MAMKRILVSVSEELYDSIEKERKSRKRETVPEAARSILSDYFRHAHFFLAYSTKPEPFLT